jgi:hypothetical protein
MTSPDDPSPPPNWAITVPSNLVPLLPGLVPEVGSDVVVRMSDTGGDARTYSEAGLRGWVVSGRFGEPRAD